MNEAKIVETEAGIIVEAWGEAVWIQPEDVKAQEGGRRIFTIEVATRTHTGTKLHHGIAVFESFDEGAWRYVGTLSKNGFAPWPVGTWARVATDPKTAGKISRQGAERVSLPKPIVGRVYWQAAAATREGAMRVWSTFVAPDYATFLARAEAFRTANPAYTVAFRTWAK